MEFETNGADLSKLNKLDNKIESNEDDEFNELLDDIPAHIREARLNELKMKAREQQYIQQNNHSIYHDLREDEFLKVTTQSKKCIVHFYHAEFKKCEIMHNHLNKLAHMYSDVKFAKINAEKAKFFVKKLNIQVLPAVLCFNEGILKHRLVGFEQLGNSDTFETRVLEKYLWRLKFLKKPEHEYDSENENDSDEETSKPRNTIRSGAMLNKHAREDDSD